jgi:Zn finger protein HypA/HybF involved in hydrogenase expression
MSVPSTKEIIVDLRKSGDNKLADYIETEAANYKCSECGLETTNPGIGMSESPNKIFFFCPLCNISLIN